MPLIGYVAAVDGQSGTWLVPAAGVGLLIYAAAIVVSAFVAWAGKRSGRVVGRRAVGRRTADKAGRCKRFTSP